MGKVHSIETMGLVDGPGVRFTTFFQGCQLRCIYCHNPDTWCLSSGKEISAQELFNKALRFKPYFNRSGGGVTCSGGEPLLQPDFLIEFFKLCKEEGIHTTLDTAGFGLGRYEEILKYTDLVILDIKHYNHWGYKKITGKDFGKVADFIQALDTMNSKLWIRHVVVPGITDSKEHIKGLKRLVNTFNIINIEKLELLPYHDLALDKYKKMGINYKLAGIKPLDREKLAELQKVI